MNTERPLTPEGTVPARELADEAELWRLRDTDPRACEELVERYLAYAKSVAVKFSSGAESLDDLVQVASLGLVNAINRFDPNRGIPFLAFAGPTIQGELKRHFRDRASVLHIPRSLYDRINRVGTAATELAEELNREPSVAEIAAELDTSEHDVREAVDADRNRHPVSLDQPAGPAEDGSFSPAELLGAEDENLKLTEERILIEGAAEQLTEQERDVLILRFRQELTQSEIGERIGRSQMHVSRLLRHILDRMRQTIPGAGPDDPAD